MCFIYLMACHDEGFGPLTSACGHSVCEFYLPEGGSLSRERRVISASLHLLLYPVQYQGCRGEIEKVCQGLGDFNAVCTGSCVCVCACVVGAHTKIYTHKPLC